MQQLEQQYTEESFWRKVAKYARTAGREVMEKALQLYYAAESPDTPSWARKVVYGALAYFILPADAVPDLLPGLGYTDDLGVLVAALATIASYVTPEVKARADEKLQRWFGGEERREA